MYPLTVTIHRAGQVAFGFQLSAVADATNAQAGSFSPTGTVQVICGTLASLPATCGSTGAIQFAEHRSPQSGSGTGTFSVNWTAPTDTSLGTIRFNVAGNAANGDGSPTGDYIFTNKYLVPIAPGPDLSNHAYTLVDRGGISVITDGSGNLGQGYARIQPIAPSTTPAGVAIFGFRANNVLVSETGVPGVPKVTAGRIYAEISNPPTLNTGVAIANPNNSPANITFSFTDSSGNAAGTSTTQILANQQIAQFLNSAPFNVYPGPGFQGTFSFTSDQPVGVVALRGLTNERGDFLMSTLPVIDTTLPPVAGTVVVPHFADGGGWITQIFLVNPTDTAMSGSVQFTDTNGNAVNVTIAGSTSSTFQYSIPPRSSKKLATAGAAAITAQGSVKVMPTGGGAAPTALVVFSYKPAAVTVTEAGVPVTSGTAFRMYVENGINMDSGIAVADASSGGSVTFDIRDLNGAPVPGISPVTIPPLPASGQTAKFLAGIFPTLPNPFKGVLRITTTSSGISVVGLRTRTNERGDFLITTTPPSNEASTPSMAEFEFSHLVNGGGYTTQFILFSGTAGQSSSGNLHFVHQDGTSFSLNVN